VSPNRRGDVLRLHDIPFELVPCEVPLFLVHTQARFFRAGYTAGKDISGE
jgi:DNA polymerase V